MVLFIIHNLNNHQLLYLCHPCHSAVTKLAREHVVGQNSQDNPMNATQEQSYHLTTQAFSKHNVALSAKPLPSAGNCCVPQSLTIVTNWHQLQCFKSKLQLLKATVFADTFQMEVFFYSFPERRKVGQLFLLLEINKEEEEEKNKTQFFSCCRFSLGLFCSILSMRFSVFSYSIRILFSFKQSFFYFCCCF